MMFSSTQYDGGFTSSQMTQSDAVPSPAKSRDPQGVVPLTVKQISQGSQSSGDDKSSFHIDGVDVTNFSMQMSVDGLKDIDQRVIEYLQQPSSLAQEKGVHRNDIAQNLKLPVDKIMQSISCLEDEGLIYSTIDEFHFNSTARYKMSVDDLKDIHQRVIEYLQQPSSLAQEKGVHRNDIAQNLKLPVDKIMQSISCLEDEGLIYSTIDEFHFNSTARYKMSVDDLKDIHQRVIEYLQQPSSLAQEKGVHRDDIAQNLKLSVDKIMQSISCLEDEGLIFSTIDEFHFKSTAA